MKKIFIVIALLVSLFQSGVVSACDGYTVQSGNTLYSIARANGETVRDLMGDNGLTSTTIYVGQCLKIRSVSVPTPLPVANTMQIGDHTLTIDQAGFYEDHSHDPSLIFYVPLGSDLYQLYKAHNDGAGLYLYDLALGDIITVRGAAYKVTHLDVQKGKGLTIYPNELEIFTCYPKGATSAESADNYVVRAVAVR